ncbi:hypothetical protein CEXT_77261 [Caerostris extrusa]|uniref:Uncharacterized protein n=1 Tax=Caerostris extrusa TaxID=172846 RepID=A0AAV4UK58_CAEEX|nr:hypothetical protein CEXT_77261 [Caerostris extrusa]
MQLSGESILRFGEERPLEVENWISESKQQRANTKWMQSSLPRATTGADNWAVSATPAHRRSCATVPGRWGTGAADGPSNEHCSSSSKGPSPASQSLCTNAGNTAHVLSR